MALTNAHEVNMNPKGRLSHFSIMAILFSLPIFAFSSTAAIPISPGPTALAEIDPGVLGKSDPLVVKRRCPGT